MMVDSLIEQKQGQRKALLRALYGLVHGREGFTITPMQYFALGTQIGLQQDVTGQTVRFLASEGLLEYKPASEAVALTHNGVVEAERQRNQSAAESQKAQLEALPQLILGVLRHKLTTIQMEELKESLPDFSDVPDSDWYATINDLLSDGMIDARVVRSGIYDAVGAAYNIRIAQRGRALTPDSPIESMPPRDASSESDERKFARLAIEEARKSLPEDERVHPRVGVVVVKDGRVLATAFRGEFPQCHAEYVALEKKLAEVSLAGSTVYTTLEPCTSRNHPKVPCATRLAERKVACVVIGMLDPDDRISGRGQRALRKAGIATGLFDHDLMTEIEELNRDFIREREQRTPQDKAGEPSFEGGQEPQKVSASEVKQITLKALYMNAGTDSETFKCSSVVELPPEFVDDKAADGAIMRSIIEPPAVLIAGIDADSVEALAWKPNRLEFRDASSGETKEYIGELRASTEPNTVKFAIHGKQVKSRAPSTREPTRESPSARPCVTPAGYGIQKSDGRTGLHLVNENDTTAFDVIVPDIWIGSSRLHFWGRELYRVSKDEGAVFLQADIELSKGHGLLGNGLAQEMARQNMGTIPFTIQYRDTQNNHFVSHCLIERDVHERSGIATRFLRQELLESPGSLNADPERPSFSLDVFRGEIHSYTGSPSYFSLRNCGGRTARDIRFDPVYSRSLRHAIRFDRVSSLARDESVPLGFQAGADEAWLHKGTANHLTSFLEDNPQKVAMLTYTVTIRFLDGNVPLVEQHVLEGECLPEGGIRLRAYPLMRSQN